MRDSLLASAVELLSRDFREVAGGVPEVPELAEPTHINLGVPSETHKAVRARLKELEEADVEALKEQEAELRAACKAENEIVENGIFDAAQELANGVDRAELTQRRAEAEVAKDVLAAKQREHAQVVAQIQKVHKKWGSTGQRLMPWAEKIEVATRSTAVDFIRGGYKTFPERQRTAFMGLQRFQDYANEVLQDEQLVQDWIDEMTALDIPTGPHAQQKMLWEMMHGQDRAELEALNPFTDNTTNDKE